MKKIFLLASVLLFAAPCIQAQSILEEIVDILLEGDTEQHKYIDAGGKTYFSVPKHILEKSCGDWYEWSPAEYSKVSIVSSSKGGATVKGLKSASSTVVKYKYKVKVMKDGKEQEEIMTESFILTIRKVEPTSIKVADAVSVGWGETRFLYPSLLPEYSEASLTYETSDQGVVKVSSGGQLTGVSLGQAEVRVCADNGLRASTIVSVVVPDVSYINVTGFDNRMKVYPGETVQLGFNFGPEHAEPEVSWISTDSAIATVTEDGLVTFNATGVVRIICKDRSGAEGAVRIKVRKRN